MQTNVAGPAESLINFGFAVKLPLSRGLDDVMGIRETHPFSVVAFLKACYAVRLPGFVWVDEVAALQIKLLTMG